MSYGYAYRGYAAYGQTANVSRPVLVDADGPKVPILLSIPNQEGHAYVAKAETVVEHVRVPLTEFLVEPQQDYGRRYSSPPKARPVEHYGYKAEPVKDYGFKAEQVKDLGYKAEPVKDLGYKAEPVKDYGYKPEPVKGYGYKAEPVREYPVKDYGHKAEAVKDYGYKAEPVKDYGYKAEPVKDYGYKADPERDHGYKAEPVRDYGYKAEPVRDYGYKAEPVRDYGYKAEPVNGYGYRAEPEREYGYKAEPEREYGYKAEPEKEYAKKAEPGQYERRSEPTKVHNYGSDRLRAPSSPTQDRPPEVEEFIAKIQTDASRPNRIPPLTAAKWRQSPNSNGQTGTNGYGDDRKKPSENGIRNDAPMEPTMVKTGGNGRPSRPARFTQPARGATLGTPTSDISTAVENLREAVRTVAVNTAPPARYTVPPSTQPIRNAYAETIDSREAARRYGGSNPSRPETTGGTYTTTINNREAARKYGGTTI